MSRPEQQARDAAFAAGDPLSHNDWICTYDAEQAAMAASQTSTGAAGRTGSAAG